MKPVLVASVFPEGREFTVAAALSGSKPISRMICILTFSHQIIHINYHAKTFQVNTYLAIQL